MKIGIIDCGGYNITSIQNALTHIGHQFDVLDSPDKDSDIILLPGVGNYGNGMKKLIDKNFHTFIKHHAERGKPVIGVCLGMQLLFEGSEEGPGVPGLGLFPGMFRRFVSQNRSVSNIGYRLTDIRGRSPSASLAGGDRFIKKLSGYYYFMHSYYLSDFNQDCDFVGSSENDGVAFIPFFLSRNFCGIQFHPERSGAHGLSLLSFSISHLGR